MTVSRSCRLPAEWEPQSGVMLTWPHEHSDWKQWLGEVEPVFVAIARHVAAVEDVLIVCRDDQHRDHIQNLLRQSGTDLGRARFFLAPSNDTWARDHGPITLVDAGGPALLDFTFDGWGGKYPASLDNGITTQLHAAGAFGALPRRPFDFVLEGGGIESDGQGTLMTTESCLLHGRRNAGLARDDIEARLREYLCVDRVLWLSHGHLAGDDTDGHIDTLARFCDPETIAYVACEDPNDEHYDALRAMERELTDFVTAAGKRYKLVPLPLPQPVHSVEGRRLPATYANFLIINEAVLVPTYRDPSDPVALERLADCFPGRQIIGIDCRPLVEQYGSLHCITMQLPAGVLPADGL